jgi:hypothetical protein
MSEQKVKSPAAHTPGPWRIDKYHKHTVWSPEIIGKLYLCDTYRAVEILGFQTVAADHTLVAAALVCGVARWEPLSEYSGELWINGLGHVLRLDEFGVPELHFIARKCLQSVIRRAREAAP